MITLEHVAMEYLPGHEILKDVSLHLNRGSFHFITGASGTGKSTLLALMSLQYRATKGSIRMFGEEVTHLPRDSMPRLRRRVGMVMQDYRLLEHLTVAENVALPLLIAGEEKDVIEAKVTELLEWVGLTGHNDSKPAILSGGQKQRVAIARAVVTKPDLLLADEPTGNLDSELALRFMYLFEGLNQSGTTVLFATHDEHLISLYNHPVLRLKDGKLT